MRHVVDKFDLHKRATIEKKIHYFLDCLKRHHQPKPNNTTRLLRFSHIASKGIFLLSPLLSSPVAYKTERFLFFSLFPRSSSRVFCQSATTTTYRIVVAVNRFSATLISNFQHLNSDGQPVTLN